MQKKKLIPDALRKHKINTRAQSVFADYPTLGEITESLAEFITPHFPGAKHPLFEECILSAFKNMDVATSHARDPYIAYLVGLVTPAWHLLDKRLAVLHDNNHVAWVPMQEPVHVFLARHQGEVEIFDERAPGDASHHHAAIMLAARIMPATEANLTMQALDAELVS